ncbi:MAG: 4-hydroxythreonine-4-phosphate dehydrogenase PdxA [Deltaproteobacteria bacterium]|nr:MAG: 4-hydroxythreonine-4-phosphate dehydrogenase PdxA [Deltaproteobacteria bacterium]
MTKPLIITMGDPTGVGPEIIIRAVCEGAFIDLARPLIVAGDLGVLKRAAAVCGCDVQHQSGSSSSLATDELFVGGHRLPVQALSQLELSGQVFGQPQISSGRAMADYIEWACDACVAGDVAGMVTAPINKEVLRTAGVDFPGHTELLADRCEADEVVMMLAGERLRVCLVTTHCALREVPQRLNAERILTTIRIVSSTLQRQFGLEQPRLAVLALNPHAGEGGLFGDEEIRHIAPAIAAARSEGIRASGPHSADTLFWFAAQGEYDAVICMYHDQGLIPLKLLHFDDGVNVTLGLPIVRTSVDHGTAYDLVGTGQASAASLVAAVRMADGMAEKQERGTGKDERGKAGL